MILSAFQPQGNTVGLTAGVAALSTAITPLNLGLNTLGSAACFPSNIRCLNTGTVAIFLSFTPATAVIVLPTAGTAGSLGTPQLGLFLLPGVVEVFTCPTGQQLWVNYISTAASQVFNVSMGEGL